MRLTNVAGKGRGKGREKGRQGERDRGREGRMKERREGAKGGTEGFYCESSNNNLKNLP